MRALGAGFALLLAGCAARGAPPVAPVPPPPDAEPDDADRTCAEHPVVAETSTFFASAAIEDANSVDLPGNGDLWPSSSSGDALYTAWGDGFGFAPRHEGKRPDIGVARVTGSPLHPLEMRGTNLVSDDGHAQSVFRVWTRGHYYQKPTGLLSHGEKLYLAVQDLDGLTYDDTPAATIAVSEDGGVTWREGPSPMFTGSVFTTIMFLDFGKGRDAKAGPYVYAYGLDHNWRASRHVLDPQGLYLARIANDRAIEDRTSWELYAGTDSAGAPIWSREMAARKAVLVDCTRRHVGDRGKGDAVISQGGVVYDAPLDRYLYTSWTEYTFELYEAPAPWGPWRRFLSKDFGVPPWTAKKHGGYGTSIPSRYISEDGKTMWIQSNTWSAGVDHNNFALRKLTVVPRLPLDAATTP